MKAVRLLSGGAAHGLVEQVRPVFEAATGCTIDGVFGAVGAMKARLLSGEPADLLVLSRVLIDELAHVGHVAAPSVRDIGAVPTAVALRTPYAAARDPPANLRTPARGRRDPLPDPAVDAASTSQGDSRICLWEPLSDRLRPAPNGATAMSALAASRAQDPRCTQTTEILSTPGIVVAAPLPPGCALATTYTCAVTGHAAAPDEAASLIALLTSDADRDARRRLGFS